MRGDGGQRLQTAPLVIRLRLLLCRLAVLAGVARHVEDELERFAALFVAPALGQPFRKRRHLAIAVLWGACDAVAGNGPGATTGTSMRRSLRARSAAWRTCGLVSCLAIRSKVGAAAGSWRPPRARQRSARSRRLAPWRPSSSGSSELRRRRRPAAMASTGPAVAWALSRSRSST